jgi:RNA recognition motif-containing protein
LLIDFPSLGPNQFHIVKFQLKVSVALVLFLIIISKQMNIYVANIPFKASEQELKGLFEEYGEVSSAKIIMDKVTQRSRGFGFIEMSDEAAARQAITSLNGFNFLGKTLVVNEARPKTDAPRGGGGGYRSGGGGGGFSRRNNEY